MALIGVKTCQNKCICLEKKSFEIKRIDTFIRDSRVAFSNGHNSVNDIDVKVALIGVKTCQNKRICLEKIVKNKRIDTLIRDSRAIDPPKVNKKQRHLLLFSVKNFTPLLFWTYLKINV